MDSPTREENVSEHRASKQETIDYISIDYNFINVFFFTMLFLVVVVVVVVVNNINTIELCSIYKHKYALFFVRCTFSLLYFYICA